ncbi:MAG TPA: ATP-binding protein [Burkholderiaceae bacterium]|nr:ATP-binding protein [Burkholderiaceae bacterium]
MEKIELPDLEAATDVEIVKENLRIAGVLYYSYQLEEMQLFRVVDRIAELFAQGLLPLGHGPAADTLSQLARSGRPDSRSVRRNAYRRMFGADRGDAAGDSGGDAAPGEPNTDFLSLWMRFIAAVSGYVREQSVAGLVEPPTAANAPVRKAARELAVNLSRHGWGEARMMARRLAAGIDQAVDILGDRDLQRTFGVRDMWQVIDRVNTEQLGGARNVVRHRTQAEAGRRIIDWLADCNQASTPRDVQLIIAVEQWIAVSGTPDAVVEQYGEPQETPAAPDRPISLPLIAHDVLDALGLAAAQSSAAAHGLIAHFHGPPRSGKTLAAHMVGSALSQDVFRIDLGKVVSKTIGETEKNIDAVFDAAERAGGVLLIDEADALFGKRVEVQDAQDRYANIDVAYLLQRIERHPGLVILTSNMREHIDPPFTGADALRRCRALRFPR